MYKMGEMTATSISETSSMTFMQDGAITILLLIASVTIAQIYATVVQFTTTLLVQYSYAQTISEDNVLVIATTSPFMIITFLESDMLQGTIARTYQQVYLQSITIITVSNSGNMQADSITDSDGAGVERQRKGVTSMYYNVTINSAAIYYIEYIMVNTSHKYSSDVVVIGSPNGRTTAEFNVQYIIVMTISNNSSAIVDVRTIIKFESETYVDDAQRSYGVITGYSDDNVSPHSRQCVTLCFTV